MLRSLILFGSSLPTTFSIQMDGRMSPDTTIDLQPLLSGEQENIQQKQPINLDVPEDLFGRLIPEGEKGKHSKHRQKIKKSFKICQ